MKYAARLRRVVPPVLSVAWIVATTGSSQPYLTGDILARYLMGAPGIFLTSYVLAVQRREIAELNVPRLAEYIKLCSVAFFVYGLSSGLVVPRADFFPASILNYETFKNITGIPVQLVRAGCVLVFTYGFVRVLSIFEWQAIDSIQRAQEIKIAQLAAIVESSDDAIIGKTPGGIITSWNRGAEKIYEYTAAEMIGRTPAILIPPDYPSELPAIIEKINRAKA